MGSDVGYEPYYADDSVTLYHGDALEVLSELPPGSVDCVVTSPPYYGLRDYGEPGQYGLEESPSAYVEQMSSVFAEVRRVLARDGTVWLNLGDSYAGVAETGRKDAQEISRGGLPHYGSMVQPERRQRRLRVAYEVPPKNLLGIPWRVAFALQADGWILRNAVIWSKPNAMPESVTDRLATRYEFVFLLARSGRYWFDLDPIREPLAHPEALAKGIVFGGSNGGAGKVNGSRRRGGGDRSVYGAGKHGGPADTPPGTKPQTNKGATGDRHEMTHERGRNPGDVWTLPTQPFPEAHFAVMPPDLARQCVLAGCRPGGTVLDPFCGSGTTGMIAGQLGRRFVGIDLSAAYLDLALRTRLAQAALVEEVQVTRG